MEKAGIYLGDQLHKKENIENVLSFLHISYQFYDDEDLKQYIGYLMGISGYEKQASSSSLHFEDDLMILNNVSDRRIDQISKRLKACDANIDRKAIVTKHNKDWLLKDLMEEIQKEHQFFIDQAEWKKLLQECISIDLSSYPENIQKQYRQKLTQMMKINIAVLSETQRKNAIHQLQMLIHQYSR